jgi:hypothetical protein
MNKFNIFHSNMLRLKDHNYDLRLEFNSKEIKLNYTLKNSCVGKYDDVYTFTKI